MTYFPKRRPKIECRMREYPAMLSRLRGAAGGKAACLRWV